jgi:hypothetical protein
MISDSYRALLFEMRLTDIYNKHSWLSDQLTLQQFIKLFPIVYKRDKPILLDKPVGFDLDRKLFLEVLLAFRQSFN